MWGPYDLNSIFEGDQHIWQFTELPGQQLLLVNPTGQKVPAREINETRNLLFLSTTSEK